MSGWIKCSERMPELPKGGGKAWVIAYTPARKAQSVFNGARFLYWNGIDWRYGDGSRFEHRVTHWQPHLTPPTEVTHHLEATMHTSIQTRRDILTTLRQRSVIATAEMYSLIGRAMPVIMFRFQVKPAGRDFFHVVDARDGKVRGFRRDHNEACALARILEMEKSHD